MLGAYVGFSIGTLALTAAFTNAFIAQLQPSNPDPYQVPWLLVVVVGAAISFLLSGRDIRLLAKILLVIEGIGIVSMVALVVVIFAKGGAPTTGIDFSVFTFDGVSSSAVISGVVAAFLSWAGFEACASMGEETDDPGRNIPRALAGTLLLTGVLFVVVMFAQVVGFGTDAAGLEAFQSSGNTLGDLGSTYVGQWFSLLIIFTATVAAFGCHLATSATSGRMLYAFGRDGFGPKALAQIHEGTGGPRFATWLVVGVALVVDLLCGAFRWPDMGTGNPAIDTYFLFAVAGSVCLMVCYLLVELAAAWFVGAPKFVRIHGGGGKVLGLALPLLGAVVIAVILWFNVKDATEWTAAPLLGLYWCAVGLVIALAASGIAKRVGASLSAELATKE
jgi:amino acid transporter